MLRRKKLPQETINFWVNPIVYGLKVLDDMLNRIEFFRQNPQYRCAVMEQLVHSKLAQLFKASLELSTTEIYTAIQDEFGKNLGLHDVLISWLVTDLIMQQKIFVADRQRIDELEKNF